MNFDDFGCRAKNFVHRVTGPWRQKLLLVEEGRSCTSCSSGAFIFFTCGRQSFISLHCEHR